METIMDKTVDVERAGVGVQTVFVTNNAYDTILLVDGNDRVLSAWVVTPLVAMDYVWAEDGADAWISGYWSPEFGIRDGEPVSEELHTIAAYGEECGRDGRIDDPARREFWAV